MEQPDQRHYRVLRQYLQLHNGEHQPIGDRNILVEALVGVSVGVSVRVGVLVAVFVAVSVAVPVGVLAGV